MTNKGLVLKTLNPLDYSRTLCCHNKKREGDSLKNVSILHDLNTVDLIRFYSIREKT